MKNPSTTKEKYKKKSSNTNTRKSPYPPNFSMIAAKTTDPKNGASTWASGNQLCTPKRGILIKKAIIQNSLSKKKNL